MNPMRRRRLILICMLVLGVGSATALALTALRENVNHFYSPSEIAQGKAPHGRTFRLGGVVLEGSSKRDGDTLKAHFVVTDRFENLPVEFEGILPDLFREGQSVIAIGMMNTVGLFTAEEVLAKHDENYVPAEVQEAMEKGKALREAKANGNLGS